MQKQYQESVVGLSRLMTSVVVCCVLAGKSDLRHCRPNESDDLFKMSYLHVQRKERKIICYLLLNLYELLFKYIVKQGKTSAVAMLTKTSVR
jgi:hypothetical protein